MITNQHHTKYSNSKFVRHHKNGTGSSNAELDMQCAMSRWRVCHYYGQKVAWMDEDILEYCSRCSLLLSRLSAFQKKF